MRRDLANDLHSSVCSGGVWVVCGGGGAYISAFVAPGLVSSPRRLPRNPLSLCFFLRILRIRGYIPQSVSVGVSLRLVPPDADLLISGFPFLSPSPSLLHRVLCMPLLYCIADDRRPFTPRVLRMRPCRFLRTLRRRRRRFDGAIRRLRITRRSVSAPIDAGPPAYQTPTS